MALAAGLLLAAQDPAELVKRLGAEEIEVREDATARLVELGPSAVVALEAAVRAKDPEVAGRAKLLLKRIRIRAGLTDNLLRSIPAVDHRLVLGTGHTWTLVFWEALDEQGKGVVQDSDLDAIVVRAFRGARLGSERRNLCRVAAAKRLRSALPEIRALLRDANGDVRAGACRALADLGADVAVLDLLGVLNDRYLYARGDAAAALGRLGAGDAAPRLVDLLGDSQGYVRGRASGALRALGAKAIDALRKGTAHPDARVREEAASLLRAVEKE